MARHKGHGRKPTEITTGRGPEDGRPTQYQTPVSHPDELVKSLNELEVMGKRADRKRTRRDPWSSE